MEPVFFPLDEELALLPGDLAPRQQEHLTHLACFMPFEQAAQMLETLLGMQTTKETARSLTERMGACMEAAHLAEGEMPSFPPITAQPVPAQCVVSADGAMISLISKQWVEVRTLAIGEPEVETSADGEPEVHVNQLSYISRLCDAFTFTQQAAGELRRRRVGEARQVCSVTDGAEWCQSLMPIYRPDTLQILDFPHAAEHLSQLLEALEQAGLRFPDRMLERCLHVLKHRGPTALLRMANRLGDDLTQQKGIGEHLDYLRKREALMQYPTFRSQGWPIGSGMVESANKLVVQARLKGSGMHWQRSHVNPMLAVRLAVCMTAGRRCGTKPFVSNASFKPPNEQRILSLRPRCFLLMAAALIHRPLPLTLLRHRCLALFPWRPDDSRWQYPVLRFPLLPC